MNPGRVFAVVAVAAVAAVGGWYLFIRDSGTSSERSELVAATPALLKQTATQVGHPVYWVGPAPNITYELTKTPKGSTYVRYLKPGVPIGDPRPDFLTVGTYPFPGAYTTIKQKAAEPGATSRTMPGGGLAVTNKSQPTSVYVAYPGANYQIEVYDPSAKLALHLATSGKVQPVP